VSRQTRQRRSRRQPLVEQLPVAGARPLTSTERNRLRQRYAHLAGRSVVFGFESLGIVVAAAMPEALLEATVVVIVESTREQTRN